MPRSTLALFFIARHLQTHRSRLSFHSYLLNDRMRERLVEVLVDPPCFETILILQHPCVVFVKYVLDILPLYSSCMSSASK